jgi:hypothetical protein
MQKCPVPETLSSPFNERYPVLELLTDRLGAKFDALQVVLALPSVQPGLAYCRSRQRHLHNQQIHRRLMLREGS